METNASAQPVSHVYFRPTTSAQRCLLFDTVAQLENVSEAARHAHVGRGTYYYWRSRYETAGVAGLLTERSRAPHRTRLAPISAELQTEVLTYHQAHPGEGCRSIANAIRQTHHWEKVIGHSKVHELVSAARPGTPMPAPATVPSSTEVVHAPQPNQTINIDLCVVPVTHRDPTDWVSVSVSEATAGASAAIQSPAPVADEWPGQVFANPTLSYAEQMLTYVLAKVEK